MDNEAYDFFRVQPEETTVEAPDDGCPHKNLVLENNNKICVECGVVIGKSLSYEKEWRYYGIMDTKHYTDPNRCSARKSEDRSIFRDVDKLGFSDKIVSQANTLYEQVTRSKIFRGNTRRGIIFACVFHAHKLMENPQSCEHLIEIFDISRKVALKGLKFVNLNMTSDASFRGLQIQTDLLIREVMNKFSATPQQIQDVLQIYGYVQDRSVLFHRSRPQSVACGIVRFYTLRKNPEITMDYFRSKVALSEITINKIVKEITRILEEK